MSQLNEVIRTSGDVRRLIADSMMAVKNGDLSVDKATAIAQLSKELTASMQVEVNVTKVKLAMGGDSKGNGRSDSPRKDADR